MIFGHQADDTTKTADDQLPAGSPATNSFIVGAQPIDQDAPLAHAPILSAPATDALDDTEAPSVLEQAEPAHGKANDEIFGNLGLSDESGSNTETIPAPSNAPEIVHEKAKSAEAAVEATSDESAMDDKAPEDVESEATDIADTPNADLLVLKQQALNDLGPLVGQLEQTPEERFRTTMMMIQSTDNQALIKDAYAAAQEIENEKIRAQALLDVVNEINYFTQKAEEN